MRNPLKVFTLLCFSFILLLASCDKKEKDTVKVDNESQSAVDNAIADQEYMAVVPAVQEHAINTKGAGAQKPVNGLCDTLTLISGDTLWGMPNHVDPTYTMNISNAACARTMPDGKFRTGALSVRLTGKMKNPESMMIIKMFNYKAGLVSYSCDSMVVKTLSSDLNKTSFNVKLVNGVCKSLVWTITYKLDRTITSYPRGNGSSDPVTYIFGTSSGVNRGGTGFDVVIPEATPLVKYKSCQYISKGVMQLTPSGFATRTIDFGFSIAPDPMDGCDENASFSVNGNTVAFKLK